MNFIYMYDLPVLWIPESDIYTHVVLNVCTLVYLYTAWYIQLQTYRRLYLVIYTRPKAIGTLVQGIQSSLGEGFLVKDALQLLRNFFYCSGKISLSNIEYFNELLENIKFWTHWILATDSKHIFIIKWSHKDINFIYNVSTLEKYSVHVDIPNKYLYLIFKSQEFCL